MKRPSRLPYLILPVVLLLGFATGFFTPRDDDFFALRKNFQILGAIYEELVGGYVDPLDPEKLLRSGIDAMLHDLDPYTSFIDEADNADIDIITKGKYGGVGLNIGLRDGKVTVISPIEGASGYKQGVRAGDVITHISGKATPGMSLSDVRNLMKGEPGTAVEIVVTREGVPEPLSFLLTREEVQVKNVSYYGFVDDDTASGIGYIKLERFAREADSEVHRALQKLQQTDRLNGLIIDLRDNPGGLLEAAVNITQLFVPQGSVIVSTQGRLPQTEHTYRSQSPPMAPDVPLAILVNEFSASASEIVAGAIQDLDRGVIVGTTTFGKGLVQIIKPLPFNTSLKLTTSRYYTPSGRSIQAIDYGGHDGSPSAVPDSVRKQFLTAHKRPVLDGRGIEPDFEVTFGEPSELEQALDRRAAFFFFASHYAAQHPALKPAFDVTDEVMSDFKAWLNTQGFSYRTTAEHSIEALAANIEKSRYTGAEASLEQLRRMVEREKQDDFERHHERLSERLRQEILARYQGERDQMRTILSRDHLVQQAVGILRDPETYGRAVEP